MPVRALVTAGEGFGIAGNSIRVALARLLAAGRIERDERGRYRLGAGAEAVRRHVVAWRRLASGRVLGPARGWGSRPRACRPRHAQRAPGTRCASRPALLRPGSRSGRQPARRRVRRCARSWGPRSRAGQPVFELPRPRRRDRGPHACSGTSRAARRLPPLPRRSSSERARLPPLGREAMAESFLLGGRVIRQLVLDPAAPRADRPGGRARGAGRPCATSTGSAARAGPRSWIATTFPICGRPHARIPAARGRSPGRRHDDGSDTRRPSGRTRAASARPGRAPSRAEIGGLSRLSARVVAPSPSTGARLPSFAVVAA
jgi:hypothetical protein